MPVDPSLLAKNMQIIRERRGEEAIHFGNETPPVEKLWLPDCPGIMRITSGGIPIGRMTVVWGGANAGKSLLSWKIISAAQKLKTKRFPKGMGTCYWNVEKQFDRVFTAERGVDVDKMVVQETTVIEDIAREIEILLMSTHVHVIDSCSYAMSQDELLGDPGDWHRGLDARVWKKALNRINNAMDKEENIVIAINHASTDQTTKAESPMGGKRMEYGSDLSLHFRKGTWLFYDDDGLLETNDKIKEKTGRTLHGQREADGIEVKVRVSKSRVCRPFRSATMRLDLKTFEFDRTFELMEAAKFFDAEGGIAYRTKKPALAEQQGAKSSWYAVQDEKGKVRKVQGARGLRLLIDSDENLAGRIEEAMMAGN